MNKLKEVVKTTEKDGSTPLELAIIPPSPSVKQRAKLVFAKSWREALEAGALLLETLDKHLRSQKLWDDEKEKDYQRLREALLEGERKLRGGGIKLSEAREVALKMKRDRDALTDLLAARNRVEATTADRIADQAQFNYLVSACTVYNDGIHEGKYYFSQDSGSTPSMDDYIDRGNEPAANAAAQKVAEVLYGSEVDILGKLVENEFLKKWKFVDDKLRLIDDKGRLIDDKGRLVNQEGRFINDQGEFIDIDGRPVDAEGRMMVAFSDFLDDDGNPIQAPANGSTNKPEDPQEEHDDTKEHVETFATT